MVVVAGPPGSGKSAAFPVFTKGINFFNADDRAAQLNGGSYRAIPLEIRNIVNLEFENFVETQINNKTSFAIETTLRGDSTFLQATKARKNGFELYMFYIALENAEENIYRVKVRADAGGHSASVSKIKEIVSLSLKNLPRAIREFDSVEVFDNSKRFHTPNLVIQSRKGKIKLIDKNIPTWLVKSLKSTEFEI